METLTTPPQWLEILGALSLALAFASALFILFDIYVRNFRQKMRIMEIVYPVTALYFGPLTIWFYLKYGRKQSAKNGMNHEGHSQNMQEKDNKNPSWHQISKGVFHCGAGCTIGDIIGEWIIFATGATIAGKAIYADFLIDFIFAWLLGIIFQYYTIAPMRNLGVWEGLWEAIKADTFSIIAFQIGLFAGMFFYQEILFPHPLPKTTASYWFLMQISMIVGFFTAYPINSWLIKTGIKEAM